MEDRAFLCLIYRMLMTHGEKENAGFMRKLRCVIRSTPVNHVTENDGHGCNSMTELLEVLSNNGEPIVY